MNGLIERYVAAALEDVPDRQRAEVSREIRAAIGEMVEQRLAAGEPEDNAVRAALTELGDPKQLAASYDERPRYLIGPRWYPGYIKALRTVPGIVLPVLVVISILGTVADGSGLGTAIGSVLETVLWGVALLLFWITLGFAIAERITRPDGRASGQQPWSVDDLPATPSPRRISLGDTVPSLVALVLLGGLAIVQHTRGVGFFVRGVAEGYEHLPVVNPDLDARWVISFFGLLTLSITLELIKYARRHWTRPLLFATLFESALWIAYVVALAASEPIINPELAHRIDEGATWWEASGQANTVIAIIIIAISLQGVWEAWRGYCAARVPGMGGLPASAL